METTNSGLTQAPDKDKFVEVSISTTSGFFPTEGFDQIPVHQKVQVELDKAAHALRIKDTANWVAVVVEPSGKRTIDPSKSRQPSYRNSA